MKTFFRHRLDTFIDLSWFEKICVSFVLLVALAVLIVCIISPAVLLGILAVFALIFICSAFLFGIITIFEYFT